jgi:hypothetical protein
MPYAASRTKFVIPKDDIAKKLYQGCTVFLEEIKLYLVMEAVMHLKKLTADSERSC